MLQALNKAHKNKKCNQFCILLKLDRGLQGSTTKINKYASLQGHQNHKETNSEVGKLVRAGSK